MRLQEAVSQSLAGRTALLRLLPLSISELEAAEITCTRDEFIYQGFMPRLYDENINPTRLYRGYCQTYIERDIRQMINIRRLTDFEHFMRLLAGRVGQILNLNALAGDLGVSSTTLKEWLSVLEASHAVFRLNPYFENFGKRIIKSPKVYFTDVGLASYLLGIESPAHAARDPLIGSLFENMVVIEALKSRLNAGKEPELYNKIPLWIEIAMYPQNLRDATREWILTCKICGKNSPCFDLGRHQRSKSKETSGNDLQCEFRGSLDRIGGVVMSRPSQPCASIRGGRAHRTVSWLLKDDPDDEVRDLAKKARRRIRHLDRRKPNLDDGASPRRPLFEAFWWLRFRHTS